MRPNLVSCHSRRNTWSLDYSNSNSRCFEEKRNLQDLKKPKAIPLNHIKDSIYLELKDGKEIYISLHAKSQIVWSTFMEHGRLASLSITWEYIQLIFSHWPALVGEHQICYIPLYFCSLPTDEENFIRKAWDLSSITEGKRKATHSILMFLKSPLTFLILIPSF